MESQRPAAPPATVVHSSDRPWFASWRRPVRRASGQGFLLANKGAGVKAGIVLMAGELAYVYGGESSAQARAEAESHRYGSSWTSDSIWSVARRSFRRSGPNSFPRSGVGMPPLALRVVFLKQTSDTWDAAVIDSEKAVSLTF